MEIEIKIKVKIRHSKMMSQKMKNLYSLLFIYNSKLFKVYLKLSKKFSSIISLTVFKIFILINMHLKANRKIHKQLSLS